MSETSSDLYLTPTQQDLLINALTSNQPSQIGRQTQAPATDMSKRKISLDMSQGSGQRAALDDVVDGDDYDFDDSAMFADVHEESPDAEDDPYAHLHDKRKSISSPDEDDEGGGKRQESEDKTAKKPGRKPLTSEPTTKRKAQNRAAQRAFRDRKEKHLKDLEIKVESLEKQSEVTTSENSVLRQQITSLQAELGEYRKRLSWINAQSASARQQSSGSAPRNPATGTNVNPFQYRIPTLEDQVFGSSFPSIGDIQAQSTNNQARSKSNSTQPRSNSTTTNNSQAAYNNIFGGLTSSSPIPAYNQGQRSQSLAQSSLTDFDGLFSPSVLAAAAPPGSNYFNLDKSNNSLPQDTRPTIVNRNSLDNQAVPGLYSGSSVSNTESPGSSTDLQTRARSMGASPEALIASPTNQAYDITSTIGNDINGFMPSSIAWNGKTEIDGTGDAISWLPQQHNDSFDPVIYGDYRETHENILNQDFGSFFEDAYPLPDLGSPTHDYGALSAQGLDGAKKASSLMHVVHQAKNADPPMHDDMPELMPCNKIWDRLQSMEKFRNGEIDVDDLCHALKAKAKCSEGGSAVDVRDVNQILSARSLNM